MSAPPLRACCAQVEHQKKSNMLLMAKYKRAHESLVTQVANQSAEIKRLNEENKKLSTKLKGERIAKLMGKMDAGRKPRDEVDADRGAVGEAPDANSVEAIETMSEIQLLAEEVRALGGAGGAPLGP